MILQLLHTIKTVTWELAVVIVVNSLILTHYQRTDLGYAFVADFCYWLIRESLLFARFLAAGIVISLYTGRLIQEYIQYINRWMEDQFITKRD